VAPISWRGAVIAVLALSRRTPGAPFTDEDQNTAQLFAAQAAAAISNFHLLAETQAELGRRQQAEQEIMRRNEALAALTRRERMINEITSKIRRSADVQTVLATTASELGKALGAARANIEISLEAMPAHANGAFGGRRHEPGNGRELAS
jgi:GAF domain-containing protein